MTLFVIASCCFIAGFITRRTAPRIDKISEITNRLVISIIMPIVIISTIPDLEVSIQSSFVILMPWLGFFSLVPLSIFIARKFHFQKKELVALLLLSSLGNTAFLGIGMVQSTFGEDAVPSAVLYDQLGSFLIVATVVSLLVAIYADRGSDVKHPSAKSILLKILSFPPFVSLIIALFIPSTKIYGETLNSLFDWVALSLVPLALFIIGLQIQLKIESRYRIPLAYLLSVKLIFLPLFILLVSLLVGVQKPEFSAIVFQSAMPPMVTPAIMLIDAKIAPKLVASALGVGTVLSFISLPIWANLITKMVV